jgi:hypothetical protein
MSPTVIAVIVFACVFGGALAGMALHGKLPDHHLAGGSSDVVKLVMGLIGTMSALVLGLLIASAKGTYDTQTSDVTQLSASVVELDRILAIYGPETKETRESLRQTVIDGMAQIWPSDSAASANLAPLKNKAKSDAIFRAIQALSSQTDEQRNIKSEALLITTNMFHTRLLMYAQRGASIPLPFLIILVSWLVLLFIGFGLLTRFNGTVVTALLIGALSVAGAIFLILELDQPYSGFMRISNAPVQAALAQMNE